MIGQAYLNYVQAPGYANEHGPQHDEHGYRGGRVPLEKEPGTLRVVCLGGSTTYGWGVQRPGETYPAQLQELLAADPPSGYERVEVINGGLPWGTSAELLNHYHFKYHYYRPDVVIVHQAVNDAQAFDMEAYQPDYAHWRQHMQSPLVLPPATRWLAKSRLVGLVLVPALLGTEPALPSFNRLSRQPDIDWYDGGHLDRDVPEEVPDHDVAFLHNVRGLVRGAQRDGAAVLLMPVEFRSAGRSEADLLQEVESTDNSLRYTRHNAVLLERIAEETGAVFVPFPQAQLSPGHWTEFLHLGREGSRVKARHVAGFLKRAVDGSR